MTWHGVHSSVHHLQWRATPHHVYKCTTRTKVGRGVDSERRKDGPVAFLKAITVRRDVRPRTHWICASHARHNGVPGIAAVPGRVRRLRCDALARRRRRRVDHMMRCGASCPCAWVVKLIPLRLRSEAGAGGGTDATAYAASN